MKLCQNNFLVQFVNSWRLAAAKKNATKNFVIDWNPRENYACDCTGRCYNLLIDMYLQKNDLEWGNWNWAEIYATERFFISQVYIS